MKKLFTFLAISLISIGAMAYENYGKLTITTINNQSIRVVIDGKTQNVRQGLADYSFNNLKPGYHTIKIYNNKAVRGRRGVETAQIIYSSSILIRNGFHTDIVINRFGKAFKDEQPIERSASYNDRYDEDLVREINVIDFNNLKQTLAAESFDNTRLGMAKQAAVHNRFTSAQVKQIMDLFSFENNKLDIAKYMYEYTNDHNNYIVVYSALTYNNSKEELTRFIQSFKK